MNDGHSEATPPPPPEDAVRIEGDRPMEVHKPKPVHGWRELLNEIGVIVIGVLIALGAEQAVEAFHARHLVEIGEDTMRDNARYLIRAAATREAQSACLARRLGAIGAILDTASASGKLPVVPLLGAPGMAPFNFSSWDSVVAAQVSIKMSRQQIGEYASVASIAARLRTTNQAERDDWAELYTIVGPGRRFGEAEESRTRAALSRAVLAAKDLRSLSQDLTGAVEEAGLLSHAEIGKLRREAGAEYASYAAGILICKPLESGPKVDHYGQAPSPVDLAAPFKP